MTEAPPDELEMKAMALSVWKLTEAFMTRFRDAPPLPAILRPFDPDHEMKVVHDYLAELCANSSDTVILTLRDRAVQNSPDQTPIGGRVGRETVRFYDRILVARGLARPPINKPKLETLEVRTLSLRLVIVDFLLSVPDDDIIEVNRSAYRDYMGLEGGEQTDAVVGARLAMEHFMTFLGAFMHRTGVTDRFMARLPTGAMN